MANSIEKKSTLLGQVKDGVLRKEGTSDFQNILACTVKAVSLNVYNKGISYII